jgi:hypothetical protein
LNGGGRGRRSCLPLFCSLAADRLGLPFHSLRWGLGWAIGFPQGWFGLLRVPNAVSRAVK